MINRLIFAIVIFPLTLVFILIVIASGAWWIATGKNLLWINEKIVAWLNKLISG